MPLQRHRFCRSLLVPVSDRCDPLDGLPRFLSEKEVGSIPAGQTSEESVQERRSDQDHRDNGSTNSQLD